MGASKLLRRPRLRRQRREPLGSTAGVLEAARFEGAQRLVGSAIVRHSSRVLVERFLDEGPPGLVERFERPLTRFALRADPAIGEGEGPATKHQRGILEARQYLGKHGVEALRQCRPRHRPQDLPRG